MGSAPVSHKPYRLESTAIPGIAPAEPNTPRIVPSTNIPGVTPSVKQ